MDGEKQLNKGKRRGRPPKEECIDYRPEYKKLANKSVFRKFFEKIKNKLKQDGEKETYRNTLKTEFRLTENEIKDIEEIESKYRRNIFELLAH